MPWTTNANVAQYGGADWKNYIKTVSQTTPEKAKLIAFQDPDISYFFFCRSPIILSNGREFHENDAVFFNGSQKPWLGSAPQCDTYVRFCTTVAYASNNATDLKAAADLMFNGAPALDAVIIPINLNERTTGTTPSENAWIDPSAPGPTMLRANTDFLSAMTDRTVVDYLHSKGVALLIDGLNNHDAAGWSEFADTDAGTADAEQFALQCQYALSTYLADGIDIDDEYSDGAPVQNALAKSTYYVRQAIGTASLSKALFDDTSYFSTEYKGSLLGQNLTWGWTMSYWASPQEQLPPYKAWIACNRLLCGYQVSMSTPAQEDVTWMVQNGYGGFMVFEICNPDYPGTDTMLNTLLTYWQNAIQ